MRGRNPNEIGLPVSDTGVRTGSSVARSWLIGSVAVIGSICGTLVTDAFADSARLNLVGAALGAVVAQLVGAAGAHWRIRFGAGVTFTMAALLFTYGAFTLYDTADDQPGRTFPTPSEIASGKTPLSQPPATGQPDAQDLPIIENFDQGDGLRAYIGPASLDCGPSTCFSPVTVVSLGSRPLEVTGIELQGSGAEGFRVDSASSSCDDYSPVVLNSGEQCRIFLTRQTAAGTSGGDITLVIHQNFSGPPSYITVTESQDDPPFTVTPASIDCTGQRCTDTSIAIANSQQNAIDVQAILSEPSAFSIDATDCDHTLNPGAVCTIYSTLVSSEGADTSPSSLAITADGRTRAVSLTSHPDTTSNVDSGGTTPSLTPSGISEVPTPPNLPCGSGADCVPDRADPSSPISASSPTS